MQIYTKQQMTELAGVFDALGHARRIAIFLALKRAGSNGLTFGVLATQANIANPSLTHHIRMMKKSGLVKSKVKGKFTVFTLDTSQIEQAIKQLKLI